MNQSSAFQMPDCQIPDCQIFAGVDGGGTKCRVRLRNAQGVLIGEAEGGSGNIRLGLDLVWNNILTAIDQALVNAGAGPGRNSAVFGKMSLGLGLAGISDAGDAARTIAAGPRFGRCEASSDAHTAVLGAFSGRDGGILISGTGSAAYAWVGGKGIQVGGWGFELCDDGSAADLGRDALRAALDGQDGMAPTTDFTRAVIARFGTATDIVHFVTDARPRDYGQLAPMVMQFADAGDAVAVALVEQQARFMGRYIARLNEIGAKSVCLVGGMAPVFQPWLSPAARAVLAEPEHDALEGAILMAQGHANGLTPAKVTG
ncbi:BadF/BadG/BcrA/BcrD ATPase family protein [Asticcacaulis sp. AC402]|uniref:BadF/BadG/BcrA/BcrD ATPase family protein n=1 Tax=Asticcacaulis sp. AC402 TaxID=1282361 RepID=UPI001F36DB48|nr:BadF/BadG/BcrA/BcrD ATPase family protein [Asticcacaulis sp. AC402]